MEEGGKAGMGLCSVLGVVFIILKLCNVITWPWIWVLAPLWGPVALGLIILAIVLIIIDIIAHVKGK